MTGRRVARALGRPVLIVMLVLVTACTGSSADEPSDPRAREVATAEARALVFGRSDGTVDIDIFVGEEQNRMRDEVRALRFRHLDSGRWRSDHYEFEASESAALPGAVGTISVWVFEDGGLWSAHAFAFSCRLGSPSGPCRGRTT